MCDYIAWHNAMNNEGQRIEAERYTMKRLSGMGLNGKVRVWNRDIWTLQTVINTVPHRIAQYFDSLFWWSSFDPSHIRMSCQCSRPLLNRTSCELNHVFHVLCSSSHIHHCQSGSFFGGCSSRRGASLDILSLSYFLLDSNTLSCGCLYRLFHSMPYR